MRINKSVRSVGHQCPAWKALTINHSWGRKFQDDMGDLSDQRSQLMDIADKIIGGKTFSCYELVIAVLQWREERKPMYLFYDRTGTIDLPDVMEYISVKDLAYHNVLLSEEDMMLMVLSGSIDEGDYLLLSDTDDICALEQAMLEYFR